MARAPRCRGRADVDDFAPRLSFFDSHPDFFEEIAAPRRAAHLGALRDQARRRIRARDGALPNADRRASAHRAQPENNIVRTAKRSRRCSAERSRCTPTRWTTLSLPTEKP
jgi:methylmalonyl-CoA mutase N-terminal domain/subunit